MLGFQFCFKSFNVTANLILNLQTNFYDYRKPDDKFEGWILDILRLIEISAFADIAPFHVL